MIERSEGITNLAVSLLTAQKSIGTAIKGSQNPYFKSKYADFTAVIDAVKEPLNSNGICFLQAVNMVCEKPVVETILLHETGEWLSSITPVYCLKINDPQALGSGITYAKRYALQAMLGLPTEDDDGNSAAKPPSTPPVPAKENYKALFGKLPKMNEHEKAGMDSVWLIAKGHKPEKTAEIAFKFEMSVKLYNAMKHWPTTQQEQEEAITILDKEYNDG